MLLQVAYRIAFLKSKRVWVNGKNASKLSKFNVVFVPAATIRKLAAQVNMNSSKQVATKCICVSTCGRMHVQIWSWTVCVQIFQWLSAEVYKNCPLWLLELCTGDCNLPVGLNYNVIYNHRNLKTQRNPAVFLLTSAMFIFWIYLLFHLAQFPCKAHCSEDIWDADICCWGLAIVGLKCAASCNHRIMYNNLKMCRLVKKRGRYNMPVVWNASWNHTICDIFHLTGAEGTTVWLKMCNHRITYNNFKKMSLRFCYKKKKRR